MKGLPNMIKIWKAGLPNVRAEELTETRIESFLRQHVEAGELSPATRNRHLGQLKAVFNWALNREPAAEEPRLITHNPAARVKKTDENQFRRERLLRPSEIQHLLNAAEADFRRFLLTALHTGMRRGELRSALERCRFPEPADPGPRVQKRQVQENSVGRRYWHKN